MTEPDGFETRPERRREDKGAPRSMLPALIALAALVTIGAALGLAVGLGGGENGDPGPGAPPPSSGAAGSEETGRVEPEVWATDICTAMRELKMSAQSASRELADEARAATSAKEVQTAMVTFVTELLDETDAMLKKIDAAGTPAGEQGEEIRRAFRNSWGQYRRVAADALVQFQNLPTGNVSAFNSELETLARSAELAFDEVERQFADLQYLEADLEGEPPEACQDLGTSD